MRLNLLTVVLLLLAVATPSSAAPSLASIRSLGVIAALDDRLTVVHVGQSIEDAQFSSLPIADWNLDNVVTAAIRANISSAVTVEPVDHSTNAVRSVEVDVPRTMVEDLRDALRDMPAANVDAYVIVKPFASYADLIGASRQKLEGLGIYRREAAGPATLSEFAYIAVFVFDAKSRDLLASAALCRPEPQGSCQVYTTRPMDAAKYAPTATELNEGQKLALKEDFTDHLSEGIKGAVGILGFPAPAPAQ